MERVRATHEDGGASLGPDYSADSRGWRYDWSEDESRKNLLRTHTTAVSSRTLYQIAQWFPRAAAFSDYEGWHNKAFLGRGEFTLEFGDYDVSITVPQDFIVSATCSGAQSRRTRRRSRISSSINENMSQGQIL